MEKLEVHVQQARDIQNICIYHKQDVYAKISLTSDPSYSLSTKIINGGGRNPIFNETLQLDIQTIDSSLKCEIWMLSRVKNYMEDQLLGFALIPLQDIVVKGGKLSGEFSVSSTDIFHSPAGFVQLSFAFSASTSDIVAMVPPQQESAPTDLPCEYEKIEFPDLEIVDENKRMVSEIFGVPRESLDLESDCSESPDSGGVRLLDSFSSESPNSAAVSLSLRTSSLSAVSVDPEEKILEVESAAKPQSINKVDVVPENGVVQQEIVDMYMKSMQQFTESLAKMKLPMDMDLSDGGSKINAEEKSGDAGDAASRVFYGSRAFF